nr:hypothetical protein [Tanacetum cinerariifolium]
MASEQSSLEAALHEMNHATPSSGLVPNPPSPAPVASPDPVVEAPAPVGSIDTPSSTSIVQNAPSASTSQTSPETPSLVIPLCVEEVDHDIEIAYMDNTPYVDVPIPKPSFKESSSQAVTPINVHSINQPPNILDRWTKSHPIANVIRDPRKQLRTDAMWCYFDTFLTFVKLNNFKEAVTEPSWIDVMQEEIHEFQRLKVWELVPCLDKVLLIKLKWIYKVKKTNLVVYSRTRLDIMTSKAQQIKLDNALVAPKNRCIIGKYNMRINLEMKPKEPTYQVVFDALAPTTCYPTFLITGEVPIIYMHQFWETVIKHKSSYQFTIDKKRFFVNVEVFRDILNICSKVPRKAFDEPPTKEEALSFICELGHTGEIKYIIDVIVDHLHQPWRTFASIINKCLCRKDLAYQIDNIDSKKQDKMFYPRFTKIIIHHFLTKDKSISMGNKMFMHTARDDSLLETMIFVSRHADTQVYGAILPKAMTNQALLDSVAYKTYYAIASGVEPLKLRKSLKKSDLAISFKESPSKKKPVKAKKDAATKPKPTKKKAPVKTDRGKGLNVLLEVALYEAAQLKEATKQRNKDFHISQESGFESWGNSDEEDDDDEDDYEDVSYDNDDGDDDDNDDDSDDERTELDRDEIFDSKQTNEEQAKEEEEYDDERVHTLEDHELTDEEKIDDEEKMDEDDDEVIKELYKDVNVNLGSEDADMTHDDQGRAEEHNVSQESRIVQEEEDAHMSLTTDHDTQKTEGPLQSSSVSSDFRSKLLNLENVSLTDYEIASLMDTKVHLT